jgi:CRISPR/Cas system-associated exonuclease Cas4 (RecB family)
MTAPSDDSQGPIIRASEIAQYAYCARAWWLGRVKGYRSANVEAMRAGTVRHRAHGRAVEGYHLLRRLSVALMILAGLALLVWLVLSLGS